VRMAKQLFRSLIDIFAYVVTLVSSAAMYLLRQE
jgi:hypothetical protein